jgi:hypothetical protein
VTARTHLGQQVTVGIVIGLNHFKLAIKIKRV